MKIGFMSSVCPKQTLPELVKTANKYGYKGIEFRVEWGHKNGIELTATDSELAAARKILADGGIEATCIATGCKFNMEDPAEQKANAETLRKYIALAAGVGAPYLRTFGDGLSDDASVRSKTLDLAAESYASVNDWAKQHGVEVLVETHTNMLGQYARHILAKADASNLNVLWHIGHHLRYGQSVDECYPYIRGHVRHLHFGTRVERDGVVDEAATKRLDAENLRSFELLKADGFGGFFSVEVIDPEDSDDVLRRHMAKYQEFMAAVG